LAVESLENRTLLAVNPMTAAEQHMHELINLSRSDPDAAAARYNTALNAGLAAGTISSDAKPPLARNDLLREAMELHLKDMQQNSFFDHDGSNGSTFDERIVAAGYTPFTTVGENIAWRGTTGQLGSLLTQAELLVEGWFESSGHRRNLMSPNFKEAGSSLISGPYTQQGTTWNAAITGQDFGTRSGNSFLTGLGCTQKNATFNICDVTNPVTGATVQAVRQNDNQTFTTTTGETGEYDLRIPAGIYTVTITGGGLNGQIQFTNIVMASQNVKLDFLSSQAGGGGGGGQQNQAPTLTTINTQNVFVGSQVNVTAVATDPDNDTITYSLDQAPAGATINANTGAFAWMADTVGSFTVTVRATDDGTPNLSDTETFTINVSQVGDLTPPTVTSLVGNFVSNKVTGFTVTFSELLDPTEANDQTNYMITSAGRDKRIGSDDDVNLTTGTPTYSAAARTVLVPLVKAQKAGGFRVTVNGTTGITDLAGNRLDGDSNGAASGDYQQAIVVGRLFTFKESDGDQVTLRTSVGVINLLMNAAGDRGTLNLVAAAPATLTGKVRKLGLADGIFRLLAINSPVALNNLLPASFVVGP
jgi:uncharacterized protein YkwD